MNQRIRELLVKAEIEIKARRPALDEEPDGYVESDNDFMGNNCEAIIRLLEEGGLEKFAELIVGECINTLEFHGFDDAVPYIKWMATNNLGVKE